MSPEIVEGAAKWIAIGASLVTVASNIGRLTLEWLKQRHEVQSAQIKQSHDITNQYLDRALDPNAPLAIRHQLLRFLATPDVNSSRLSTWAESELKRIGGIVDETNRAVVAAEEERQRAKTTAELAEADKKLAEAVRKQSSLLEPPIAPPATAAALRAGFLKTKCFNGLNMKGADLSGAYFSDREFRGADFSEANLKGVSFEGCDLRAANLSRADLTFTRFWESDLRGADLSNAQVNRTTFRKVRLEGADMRAQIVEIGDFGATFDNTTQWPDDFDPIKAGAVNMDGDEQPGPSRLPPAA